MRASFPGVDALRGPKRGSTLIVTHTRESDFSPGQLQDIAADGLFSQVVVVDDLGAGDGARLALPGMTRSNVSVVRHTIAAGLSAARYTGLAVADGEFVFFTDTGNLPGMDDILRYRPSGPGCDADVVLSPRALKALGAPAWLNAGELPSRLPIDAASVDPLSDLFGIPLEGNFWRRDLFADRYAVSSREGPYLDFLNVPRLVCAAREVRLPPMPDATTTRHRPGIDVDQRENLLIELLSAFGGATDGLKADRRRPIFFEALARAFEGKLLDLCEAVAQSTISSDLKASFIRNALLLKVMNFQHRDGLKTFDQDGLVTLLQNSRRFAPRHGLVW